MEGKGQGRNHGKHWGGLRCVVEEEKIEGTKEEQKKKIDKLDLYK
jgi:hypothetical protein